MGDLSTTAVRFKLVVKWIGISLVAFALLWILWLFLVFIFRLTFPPPPPTADNAFGILPNPFQTNSENLGKINFNLEIPEGLNNSTQLIPVYLFPTPKAELSSLDKAKQKARLAGLDSDPIKISDTEWRWTNKRNTNKVLDLNIVTNNFVFTYDWATDPNALEGNFKTNDSQTITLAKNYLKKFGSLTSDLDNGPTRITYIKYSGNQRNVVSSYSEANAVEVAIYRDKIEGRPFVEQHVSEPLVKVIISQTSNSEKQLIGINYTYWKVDLKTFGTYQTRSPSQAFGDLKKGVAIIAEGAGQEFESITISKVSLAYFNPSTYKRFALPVYVFEGQGEVKGEMKNFVAYVSAVEPSQQSK